MTNRDMGFEMQSQETGTSSYINREFTSLNSYNYITLGSIGRSGRSLERLGMETRVTTRNFESVVACVETDTVDVYCFGALAWVQPDQSVVGSDLQIDAIPYITSSDALFITSIDLASEDHVQRVMETVSELAPKSVIVVVAKDAGIVESIAANENVRGFVKATGTSNYLHPITL